MASQATVPRDPLRARVRRLWQRWRTGLPGPLGLPTRESGPPWPQQPLVSADFLAALSRREPAEPRVRLHDLGLVRGWSGDSAIAAAQRQRDEGYKARTDTPAFSLALPIDWNADPFRDANWRSQLHMLRLIDPFLRAHGEQPGADWLRRSFDIVLDWHRHLMLHGRQEHVAWRDMMVGVRALRLAHLFELLRRGELSALPAEVEILASLLALHAQALTAPGFFRYTNHTVWDLHGLTALVRVGLCDDDPRRAAWMKVLGSRLDRLVDLQFDEHGVHRENSPQYHGVARTMFDTLLDSRWYDDSSARLVPVLERARSLQHWMSLPDGRPVPIGDSDGRPPTRLELPEPRCSAAPIEVLAHSCYGFVRHLRNAAEGDWSFIAMKAGFDLPGHKHEDVFSYLWSESGCDIVVDSGKFAYDDTPMRRYMRSNRAHNLIEFGGRDSDVPAEHRPGHCLRAVVGTAWGRTLPASIVHHPGGERHERTLHTAPGRWLVVVDRFTAPRETAFRHFTHLAPEFAATVASQEFDVKHQAGGGLAVRYWASTPLTLEVVSGQQEPEVQGWISRSYRQSQPCPVLVMSGSCQSAVTVLALSLDASARLNATSHPRLVWTAGQDRLEIDVSPLMAT